MSGSRGQEQSRNRCLGPSETGYGVEGEWLVDLSGPTVDRASDEIGIQVFHVVRSQHGPLNDAPRESGGDLLELGLHPGDDLVPGVGIPFAWERSALAPRL